MTSDRCQSCHERLFQFAISQEWIKGQLVSVYKCGKCYSTYMKIEEIKEV